MSGEENRNYVEEVKTALEMLSNSLKTELILLGHDAHKRHHGVVDEYSLSPLEAELLSVSASKKIVEIGKLFKLKNETPSNEQMLEYLNTVREQIALAKKANANEEDNS